MCAAVTGNQHKELWMFTDNDSAVDNVSSAHTGTDIGRVAGWSVEAVEAVA